MMSHPRCLLSLLVLLSSFVLAAHGASGPHLVIVGGGKVSDEMRRELLTLSGVADPVVLVIPHAARPPDRARHGATHAESFRRLGVTRVEVLDLDNPAAARAAIARAQVIWMPGGLQRLLMAALDAAGATEAVRARVAAGVPIGGTSAGAAVMSDLMIEGTRRDSAAGEMDPLMSRGLGFWPEVIVDQHFSQRKRLPRLRASLGLHPQHIGLGIDEDTAVIYNGSTFRVLGDHTVTLLRAAGPGRAPQSAILRAGDVFDFAAFLQAAPAHEPAATASSDAAVALCDAAIPDLMNKHRVPGVSVALIRDHAVAWLGQYGVKTAGQSDPVDAQTVFEAASMSKPLFAYLVLQLVQEGRLDLDRPLVEILGGPYPSAGPGHERITARMVLTHTTGFPNWRPGGRRSNGPLPVLFEPGTQRRYSGEGFHFLQQAVENLTGETLEQFSRRRLLDPLDMKASSYVWNDTIATHAAAGHTGQGRLPEEARPLYRRANSAFTLYTTPADYARFVLEMMRTDRSASHSLDAGMLATMLTPHPTVAATAVVGDADNEDATPAVFGLGWRVDDSPTGPRVHHSGSNRTGFRCYTEFHPATGDGIVIMTNAVGGRQVWADLIGRLRRSGWPARNGAAE